MAKPALLQLRRNLSVMQRWHALTIDFWATLPPATPFPILHCFAHDESRQGIRVRCPTGRRRWRDPLPAAVDGTRVHLFDRLEGALRGASFRGG